MLRSPPQRCAERLRSGRAKLLERYRRAGDGGGTGPGALLVPEVMEMEWRSLQAARRGDAAQVSAWGQPLSAPPPLPDLLWYFLTLPQWGRSRLPQGGEFGGLLRARWGGLWCVRLSPLHVCANRGLPTRKLSRVDFHSQQRVEEVRMWGGSNGWKLYENVGTMGELLTAVPFRC